MGSGNVMGTPHESPKSQNTPEMNELEFTKTFLKIWASNFENQKSYSSFKIDFFLCEQIDPSGNYIDLVEMNKPQSEKRSE